MSGTVHSLLQAQLRLDAVINYLKTYGVLPQDCEGHLAHDGLQQFSKKNINVQLPGLILKFKLKLELAQLILTSNGRVSHRLIVITHKGWDASKVSYWIHPSKIFLVVLDAV